MFQTVVIVFGVMVFLALVGIHWYAQKQERSDYNTWIATEAKWPLARYGRTPEEQRAHGVEPIERDPRMKPLATAAVLGAMGTGLVAGYLALSVLDAQPGIALLVLMGATYFSSWTFLLAAGFWLRRHPRS